MQGKTYEDERVLIYPGSAYAATDRLLVDSGSIPDFLVGDLCYRVRPQFLFLRNLPVRHGLVHLLHFVFVQPGMYDYFLI